MKTKYFVKPAAWAALATVVVVAPAAWAEDNPQRKPPREDAQKILDQLNSERTSMTAEDGSLDPQEVEHVRRMIRLYELRAGYANADDARRQLGLAPREPSPTDTAQNEVDQQQQQKDIQQLRTEVVDLRQQLQDLQQSNEYQQKNGTVIEDAAGASNRRGGQYPRKP